MRCPKCGEELPEGAKFCFSCGTPIIDVNAPAPRKLEEPLDASLAGGAVPMVPVGPPPRAMRMTPRAPRPYVARTASNGGWQPTRPASLFHHHDGNAAASGVQHGYEAALRDVEPEAATEQPEVVTEPEQVVAAEPVVAEPADVADVEKPVEAGAETEASEVADPVLAPKDVAADVAVDAAADTTPSEEPVEAELDPDATVAASPLDYADESELPEPAVTTEEAVDPTGTTFARTEGASRIDTDPAPAVIPDEPSFEDAPAPDFASYPQPARPRIQGQHVAVVAVCVAVAAVLVFVVVQASAGWFSPFADRTQDAPQVQPPSDGSVEPLQGEDADGEDAGALPEGAPEVRAAVADYSWDELSQISELLSSAADDNAALELAEQYHLCTAAGKLDGTQTKDVKLTSGATVTMRVAGFLQDNKADGSGKAGITFVAQNSASDQPINAQATTAGGWEKSTLRTWMADTLLEQLPAELSDHLVAVSKLTNPAPGSGSAQQKTADTLWLPSYSEVVGQISSYNKRAAAGYKSEGAQYQLFADAGVTWDLELSPILVSGGTAEYWWLRSPDVSNSAWFMCVTPAGQPTWGHKPATVQGVLMGFCL